MIEVSLGSLCKLLQNENYHLCTSFLGTQILCRALSRAGNNRDAVTTFLQKDYPGWLYPITMGATMMWERWNSLQPEGKINPNGMNSFNHYAYGICSINPIEESPGFKKKNYS